jgi:hypothetical protein
MSLKFVSPRLLAKFVRATEDVAIMYELGLVGSPQDCQRCCGGAAGLSGRGDC